MKVFISKIGFFIIFFSFIITNCISVCASDTELSGIDVSDYQGTIDFSKVKDTVDVVIIRSSSGSDYEDSEWETNYENAKTQGLYIGFYQYVTATSVEEAKTQANYFYNLVKDKTYDFGLAMDFEPSDDLSAETVNEIASTYLEELKSLTGKTPIIYSDVSRIENLWDSSLSQYPLWVAEYGLSEPSNIGDWSDWIGFQYSDTGTVSGIDGNVDLDYFKSSFISDDTSTSSTNDYYTVKYGDTLWQIALKYNTSVSVLAEINDISNPSLIYPNEIIKLKTENTSTYTVKSGDSLWSIATKYNISINYLIELNNIQNPNLIYPNQVLAI
ncbi:MAG: GH25 family lysozyme [Clostridia bacterium]